MNSTRQRIPTIPVTIRTSGNSSGAVDVSQHDDFVGETGRMVEQYREKVEALYRERPGRRVSPALSVTVTALIQSSLISCGAQPDFQWAQ